MRMYQTDTDGEIVLIIYPANPKKNLGLKNGWNNLLLSLEPLI